MSINKKIILCFIALVVVGTVSLTLLHRSPKYQEQQQAQNAQTVHSQDTKLPYDYLNNVIAQSGAACSVYYHSLENDDVFYNYSGKMPAGDLARLYVAAGVLRQVEDGDLSLDEACEFHLCKECSTYWGKSLRAAGSPSGTCWKTWCSRMIPPPCTS